MEFYLYGFVFSFFIGSIKDFKCFKSPYGIGFSHILKGALPLLLCRWVNPTGLTLLITSVGVLLGHLYSPFNNFKKRPAMLVSMGSLVAFAPHIFIYPAGTLLFIYFLTKNIGRSFFYTAFLLPIIMWLPTGLDIYMLFGALHGAITVYQLIPFVGSNSPKWDFFNIEKILSKSQVNVKRVAITSVIIITVVLFFFNRYVYRGFGMQVDIIRKGIPDLPFITLTFDDGPDPKYTPMILDILAQHDITATFFVVGNHVRKYPEIAIRIVEEGHNIANHTNTHRSLIPLSHKRTMEEIDRCSSIIEEITSVFPIYFRPPRGVYTDFAREYLRENGYTMVLWDVTSKDWSEIRSNEIVKSVVESTVNGSIILLHDSGNLITSKGGDRINTVKALPQIITRLKDQGFIFICLDEMILYTGLMDIEGEILDDSY